MIFKMNSNALAYNFNANGVKLSANWTVPATAKNYVPFGVVSSMDGTIGLAGSLGNLTTNVRTTANARSGLTFYKGTPATQAEIDAAVELIDPAAPSGFIHSADVLVYFRVNAYTISTLASFIATFLPTAAVGSGVATWFTFGTYGFTFAGSSTQPGFLVSGSVTSVGGGGDIELLNTTFTNGSTYRIPQYELVFPKSFSV
jgi:hypothetical protein